MLYKTLTSLHICLNMETMIKQQHKGFAMSMESSIYLACNSVVKDGVVLGYQVGATIDGNIIQPPDGYPHGFMVRKGSSWSASLDSSWNTQAAAEVRASRLNKIDNTNEWCVMVI